MRCDEAPSPFALEWRGGSSASLLRRRRPGIESLPWGTLFPCCGALSDRDLEEARGQWTAGAFSEYASAAAFSSLTAALLEAGAPIDLIAMCADFVVDELTHVELTSRMAMEYGGAAPMFVSLALIAPSVTPGLTPLHRAVELAVRTSCVGEALSVPALTNALKEVTHPLEKEVLRRILRDEGPHARVGAMVLQWAGDRLDLAERHRLGGVADSLLEDTAPLWAAGGPGSAEHRRVLREAVSTRVVAPLARLGVPLRFRVDSPRTELGSGRPLSE